MTKKYITLAILITCFLYSGTVIARQTKSEHIKVVKITPISQFIEFITAAILMHRFAIPQQAANLVNQKMLSKYHECHYNPIVEQVININNDSFCVEHISSPFEIICKEVKFQRFSLRNGKLCFDKKSFKTVEGTTVTVDDKVYKYIKNKWKAVK